MITLTVKDCNSFSQNFYDSVIASLQFHQLTCSCGHSACLSIHAYYMRKVKALDGSIHTLRILRVKCSECGTTHAILLSSMVPYSQISLSAHQVIIDAYESAGDTDHACTDTGSIDENNVKYIILSFSDMKREDLHGFISTQGGFARKTMAACMYSLRVLILFLNETDKNHTLDRDDVPRIKYVSRRSMPKVWSEDECRKLLSVVDTGTPRGKRDYAILMLVINTGMRQCDILNLKFENINWSEHTIEFVQQKTGIANHLHLDDATGWAIIDYLKNGRPENGICTNVFLRHRAPFVPLESFYTVLTRYLKLADIHVQPEIMHGMHSLRHSLAFLEWLEKERNCTVSTRNQRLAALSSFFRYAQIYAPASVGEIQKILSIPFKKRVHTEISYIGFDDMKCIISQPDTDTWEGCRDRAMLLTLYDTGARVSELINLRIQDIRLEAPAKVTLHGKGMKQRNVPLTDETRDILREFLQARHLSESASRMEWVFENHRNEKFTRAGISYIIKKYADRAREKTDSIPDKITPHIFRHSKAMHLLQAGVNIVYIKDILGHSDITTTQQYLRADMEMKKEAMDKAKIDIRPQENSSAYIVTSHLTSCNLKHEIHRVFPAVIVFSQILSSCSPAASVPVSLLSVSVIFVCPLPAPCNPRPDGNLLRQLRNFHLYSL